MTLPTATLPLGSGTLALCPLPGLGRPLEADLAAIRALRPGLVLSLTEPAELRRLGLPGLPARLRDGGTPWRGFPIPDFGIPADDDAWPALSALAHTVTGRGGTVLVHCRGGLGRSGMVALRLMVEHGEEPGAALARLRAARPGAVETEAQHRWATTLP